MNHFLQQRYSVGPLDDVLPEIRRKELVAGDAVDHRVDFALGQPIDRERGHVQPPDPGRSELRPERNDQQCAKARDPVHRPIEHFQAGWVVQCTSSKIISTGLWRSSDVRNERLECSLPALRPGQIERGIASVVRQRKHFGEQRGVFNRGRCLRQHRIELVELRLRRIVALQPGGAFHLADDG